MITTSKMHPDFPPCPVCGASAHMTYLFLDDMDMSAWAVQCPKCYTQSHAIVRPESHEIVSLFDIGADCERIRERLYTLWCERVKEEQEA